MITLIFATAIAADQSYITRIVRPQIRKVRPPYSKNGKLFGQSKLLDCFGHWKFGQKQLFDKT